jgi:hypothetical protein
MLHNRILALCAVAAGLTLASKSTAQWEHSYVFPKFEPTPISQLPNDQDTQNFIRVYLRHGDQFNPRLTGD